MASGDHKVVKAAADWGAINEENRLCVPSEITDCLSWFTPKKRMPVSIDLSKPRIIVVRYLPEVQQLLEERRETLVEDSEDDSIGMRRVAMSHYFFREAILTVPERRIGLKGIILDHLETRSGGRLLCLGFADRIEAHNEASSRELILRHANDLSLG